jgi:hypothetical protein
MQPVVINYPPLQQQSSEGLPRFAPAEKGVDDDEAASDVEAIEGEQAGAPREPAPKGPAPKAPRLQQGEPQGPAEPQQEPGEETTLEEVPENDRTSDDVRSELRDFLNGVKEKLDETPSTPASPADLLDYLDKLSDYLPEQEKKRFLSSGERLAMESLKSRLSGSKGLRRAVAERFRPAAPRRKEPLTRPLVVDTFSYLKDLSAWHPDKAVGDAMRERIESLVARMRRAG